MVFGVILSVVKTHNFKINVRDKLKLKKFNPTHLSKNYEKIDVLIIETVENDCEFEFLTGLDENFDTRDQIFVLSKTTLEILLPKIWSLKKLHLSGFGAKRSEFLNIFYSQNLSLRF